MVRPPKIWQNGILCHIWHIQILIIVINFSARIASLLEVVEHNRRLSIVMGPKRRVQPFRMAHEAEFGVKVTSLDASTSAVTPVVCRFFVAFGREEKVGLKRKSIATKKYFKAPFCPVLYCQHHESHHSSMCLLYLEASDAAKATFSEVVPVGDQLTSHFEGSGGQLYFTIDPEIVDVLILEVLFDPEDGQESVARATAVFKG